MTDQEKIIEDMARAKDALEIVEHVIREKKRGLYSFAVNYDRPAGPSVGFDGNTNEFYMGLEKLGLGHMETIRAALANAICAPAVRERCAEEARAQVDTTCDWRDDVAGWNAACEAIADKLAALPLDGLTGGKGESEAKDPIYGDLTPEQRVKARELYNKSHTLTWADACDIAAGRRRAEDCNG